MKLLFFSWLQPHARRATRLNCAELIHSVQFSSAAEYEASEAIAVSCDATVRGSFDVRRQQAAL